MGDSNCHFSCQAMEYGRRDFHSKKIMPGLTLESLPVIARCCRIDARTMDGVSNMSGNAATNSGSNTEDKAVLPG